MRSRRPRRLGSSFPQLGVCFHEEALLLDQTTFVALKMGVFFTPMIPHQEHIVNSLLGGFVGHRSEFVGFDLLEELSGFFPLVDPTAHVGPLLLGVFHDSNKVAVPAGKSTLFLLCGEGSAGVGELGFFDEVIVAAGVTLDGAVVDVDDEVGELSNKMHVVAYED